MLRIKTFRTTYHDEIIAFSGHGDFISYPVQTCLTGIKARLAFCKTVQNI